MALKNDQKFSCSVSANFELAKAVSIFTVVAGHFYGPSSWPLVTVALCIFGFSSAYFTDKKYAEGNLKGYWTNKFKRLFFRVIIINLFLIILLLIKDKEGLFSWQSVVHFFGATGLLNWFHVVDNSPLGDGLWFFTLLLIFYSLYPFFKRIPVNFINYYNLLFCYLLICVMQYTHPMGHMLWVTIFSFIAGIFSLRKNSKISILQFFVMVFILYLIYKFVKIKNINIYVISIFSSALCVFIVNFKLKLPEFVISISKFVNSHMVEIYFIHGYVFYRPFSNQLINFFVSVFLILSAAYLLLKTSVSTQKLVMRIYENSPHTRS